MNQTQAFSGNQQRVSHTIKPSTHTSNFKNGMRISPGPGRMEGDYTGIELPLLESYIGDGLPYVPWEKTPQWMRSAYMHEPIDR